MRGGRLGAWSVAALTLGACSFAPHYEIPQSVPAPPQYDQAAQYQRSLKPQATAQWTIAHPDDAESRGTWWTMFHDPTLDELQSRAGIANQSLKAALARLQQARDDTRVARADLFPSISANASFTRARASPYSPRFPAGSPTLGSDYDLEADFSYEVDLWGRIRNQVVSAKANQDATAADAANLELSLRAELTHDFFDLRSYDRQQLLLERTVNDYEQSLTLTRNRFDEGAAALADLTQAQTQLESARTREADIRLQRLQTEHAIAVLVGENPSSFHLAADPLPETIEPPAIDPGIPSALLQRRPDVAEAERRVASANAQIGVARAAYFPQVTLSASAGWNSVNQAVFVDAPSRFWQFGPQISLPIFEGGRLVAQTDRAKAVYAEQVANYRNTVLTAYQDVEDNLTALGQLAEENRTEMAAVLAAQMTLQQAQFRYEEGLVTYLEVANAQTTALQVELAVVQIQSRRLTTSVMLIKALGGGW